MEEGQPFDELLAEQYARVHLDLIYRWVKDINGMKILKTDSFAEALCPTRAFLWDILKHKTDIIAIDISPKIVKRTRDNLSEYENISDINLAAGDVRKLPFKDNCLDLIISDSTLDHFGSEKEIKDSLKELIRILKSGGILILTLDNKGNITDPLFQIWKWLRLGSFYIGKTYNIKQLLAVLDKLDVEIVDYTAILHNPRFFTKAIIAVCKKFTGHKMDAKLRKWLLDMDNRENSRTKFLTAQFIAVKAVKRS
jgi:ubiquinone/menaquinone biosynthesis C-methylase UbiE